MHTPDPNDSPQHVSLRQSLSDHTLPLHDLYERIDRGDPVELRRLQAVLHVGVIIPAPAPGSPDDAAEAPRGVARTFVNRRRAERLATEVGAVTGLSQDEAWGLAGMLALVNSGLGASTALFASPRADDRVRLVELRLEELELLGGLEDSPRRDQLAPLLARLREACVTNERSREQHRALASGLDAQEFGRQVAREQRLLATVWLREASLLAPTA